MSYSKCAMLSLSCLLSFYTIPISLFFEFKDFFNFLYTLEPLIKDTPNKGHLSIKDKLLVPIPIIPVHVNLQIEGTSL